MSEPSKEALSAANKFYGWAPPETEPYKQTAIETLARVIQYAIDEAVVTEQNKKGKAMSKDPNEKRYTKAPGDVRRVLAFSGGIDSTAVLASEKIDLCVFVDLGHRAAEAERRACRIFADKFEVELVEVAVSGLNLGSMDDDSGVKGPRVVTGRNAILASVCSNFIGDGGYLYFGCHKDDQNEYPDCRPEFWDYLSMAFGKAYNCHISLPLIQLGKLEVRQLLGQYLRAYDIQSCWSCYAPINIRAGDGDKLEPCGTCDSCFARLVVTPVSEPSKGRERRNA